MDDDPANVNNKITYSITGTNFQIDPDSGAITVASSSLNFEVTKSYDLVVTATDGGTPAKSTTVGVTVSITGIGKFLHSHSHE